MFKQLTNNRTLISLLIGISILSLLIGSINVFSDLKGYAFVIMEIRLPRIILAAIGGAALAISGAVYQVLLENKMADSFTLGMANGATLGAFFAITLSLPLVFISLFGIATGLLALFTVLILAKHLDRKYSPGTLIITGVLLGALFSGLLYVFIAFQPDKTNHLLSFMFGSFGNAKYSQILIVGSLFFFAFFYALKYAKQLDFLTLGDIRAYSLGVSVSRLRFTLLVVLALPTLALISFTGVIGLVGIIIPQTIQFFRPLRMKALLIKSALLGAIYLVFADFIGRVAIMPYSIPTGIVVMLSSIPIIFLLLYKRFIRMTN